MCVGDRLIRMETVDAIIQYWKLSFVIYNYFALVEFSIVSVFYLTYLYVYLFVYLFARTAVKVTVKKNTFNLLFNTIVNVSSIQIRFVHNSNNGDMSSD